MSIKSVSNTLKTILFLVLEFPFRPRWAFYRTRGFAYGHFLNRFHKKRIGEYQSRLQSLEDALLFLTDHSREEIIDAGRSENLEKMQIYDDGHEQWVVSLPNESETVVAESEGPIEIFYGPSPEQMKTVHTVCRLLPPKIVIETGVAKGFTSVGILDALEQNETGDLYSVEMPSLYFGYAQQVGEKIPESLRKRWHLELGPSALVIPRLLDQLGFVDVFVYDSSASYDNQIAELNIILAGMRPGGVVIANQINTDAFVEVAEAHDCKWTTTNQTKKPPHLCLLTKLS